MSGGATCGPASPRNTAAETRVAVRVSAAGRVVASWRYSLLTLLGLSWGRDVRADRPSRRAVAASGWEAPADAVNPLQFGRPYQLPPFGRGNGLEALFWAPLARMPAARAEACLDALAREDIPGWAAPVRRSGASEPGTQDVWAASASLDAAQDVLMRVLRG